MKQRVKVLEGQTPEELEAKVNDFLSEYEARGIQLVTTVMPSDYIEPVIYTALIKYQVTENDRGIDFNEVSHMFQNGVEKMREDYDCPMCPDCDEELDENNYCEECSKTWTEKELDEHQERENEAYVKWCEEQHPEWFDNKKA